MEFLEATTEVAHHSAKTCDIGLGVSSTLSGNFLAKTGACGPPSCMRERVKISSSTPSSTPTYRHKGGGGAPRLSRVLEGTKRHSWSLSACQAANLVKAVKRAAELNLPLNRFVTINWEAAKVPDCTKATGRFLKYASDWLRRRGHRIAYVWVQEHGPRVGQHVHMLVHVPADLCRRFSELQRRWLKACGATFRKGLIKSRPVGRSYRTTVSTARGAYHDNLRRVLAYMLKQGLSDEASPAGRSPACRRLVLGKRCSTSENIGAAARSARKVARAATCT